MKRNPSGGSELPVKRPGVHVTVHLGVTLGLLI